jgi:putative membrane protein insertion efficiency factor
MSRLRPCRRISVTPGGERSIDLRLMHGDDRAVEARFPTAPQRCALALLRAYQLTFSSMFAGSCRFVPSCSAYAIEAIERFGVIRGSWLALRRLSRCRPLAAHGFDPVPRRSTHD